MMEFVSWKGLSHILWTNKSHVPNHQPVYVFPPKLSKNPTMANGKQFIYIYIMMISSLYRYHLYIYILLLYIIKNVPNHQLRSPHRWDGSPASAATATAPAGRRSPGRRSPKRLGRVDGWDGMRYLRYIKYGYIYME
jgi:hypothetical protein